MFCFACLLVLGSLKHRQTTCLLIPLNATPGSQVPSQLEIVEQVLGSDCHLMAGRMSILDDEQQKHISETLKASSIREKVRNGTLIQVYLDHKFMQTVQSDADFGCFLMLSKDQLNSLSHRGSPKRKYRNWVWPDS